MPLPFGVELPSHGCGGCDDDLNLDSYICATFTNGNEVVLHLSSGFSTSEGTISSLFDNVVATVATDNGDTTVSKLCQVVAATSDLALPQPCFRSCGGCF